MGIKRIAACGICFILLAKVATAQEATSSVLDQSIEKGVHYLNHRIDSGNIYYLIVPLLVPLAQHYHLEMSRNIYHTADRLADTTERRQFETYRQMMEYSPRRRPQLPLPLSVIDGVNLYALYCGKAIRRNIFLQYMDSCRVYGGYDVTHAYMAALLLRNTRCLCQGRISRLESEMLGEMVKMVPLQPGAPLSDLQIEVIALLLYAGRYEYIPEVLISRLIHSQAPEGYWKDPVKEGSEFADHTTVLAVWALLEWKHRGDTMLFLPYRKENPATR